MTPKPKIGISSCLLGDRVRHDGGHKHNGFLTGTFGEWFDWVSVCPEVESGMPVPREAMRVVRDGSRTVLETVHTHEDRTAELLSYATKKVTQLSAMSLCGFILKKGSPSCGMERVPLYSKTGEKRGFTSGLFASHLTTACPGLPVEEEGRLGDPVLRENWLGRVFLYARLRSLWKGRCGLRELVDFHTAHKFLILSHSPEAYRKLGRLVAGAKGRPIAKVKEDYESQLMQAASVRATRGRHTNVLLHMLGYLRTHLDLESRRELEAMVTRYRKGEVPLLVPLTLIQHHSRRHKVKYLLDQIYLDTSRLELRAF